jgi:hypothetical protein
MRLIILILGSLLAAGTMAGASTPSFRSAHRDPGQSYLIYKHALQTYLSRQTGAAKVQTASDAAVPYGKAKLAHVTVWDSLEAMNRRFEHFRDLRWLYEPTHKDFARRSSWLYPDDGCYARAALAIHDLFTQKVSLPNKVFVFGDLDVKTENSPAGDVSWWYHVAPIVEVGEQKYVLDPAIEPRHPLKLDEWMAKMSSTPQNIEIAICASGTYDPEEDCARKSDGKEEQAQADQTEFLQDEWKRLIRLKRDPVEELGEHPPWK